jgi:hypothetical protein
MTKKVFFVVFLLLHYTSFPQNLNLSKKSLVSILTCGRGDELYTTFGHTAIRIQDSINNLDVVYNYGAFDFRTPNFYLKFIKGDLQYFINASSYEDFMFEYQCENREVIEQTLAFSLLKKQELFDLLNASLFSDERSYTYKFIDKNCTSMAVDKINKIIGKKIIQKVDNKSLSYRELLYPYFENHFYYKLGINIIFGAKTDCKAEKLFLPVELMHSLSKAKINKKPIVTKTETKVNGAELDSKFSFINSIYFIIVLLFLIVVSNKKYIYMTYLFISGLIGLFISLVGFYSLHQEVLWNYNALLLNPLFLILPILRSEWFKKITFVCMMMVGIYILLMITKPHLLLMLPFIGTTSYILYKFQRKT